MDLLSLYEDVSGQKINRDKTTLFFSKSVIEANRQIIFFLIGNSNRQIIKGVLGVREIQHYEKY